MAENASSSEGELSRDERKVPHDAREKVVGVLDRWGMDSWERLFDRLKSSRHCQPLRNIPSIIYYQQIRGNRDSHPSNVSNRSCPKKRPFPAKGGGRVYSDY